MLSLILLLGSAWGCGAADTPVPFHSEGLGLMRQEWETQHQAVFQDGLLVNYHDYEAIYWAAGETIAPTAPIVALRIYGGNPDTINAEVQRLLPADAQYTKTIQGERGDGPIKVRVYTSDSLSTRYAPLKLKGSEWLPWGSDSPGTIKVTEFDGRWPVVVTAGLAPPDTLPRATPRRAISAFGTPAPVATPISTVPMPIPISTGPVPLPIPTQQP